VVGLFVFLCKRLNRRSISAFEFGLVCLARPFSNIHCEVLCKMVKNEGEPACSPSLAAIPSSSTIVIVLAHYDY